MISLKTPTKSPTLAVLNPDQRFRLIEFIAERYLDNMDVDDLARFFIDAQREYLQEYDDEELVGALEDITHEDEYNEVMEDLAK
jgi:myo-inositol catabolism protein IolC